MICGGVRRNPMPDSPGVVRKSSSRDGGEKGYISDLCRSDSSAAWQLPALDLKQHFQGREEVQ